MWRHQETFALYAAGFVSLCRAISEHKDCIRDEDVVDSSAIVLIQICKAPEASICRCRCVECCCVLSFITVCIKVDGMEKIIPRMVHQVWELMGILYELCETVLIVNFGETAENMLKVDLHTNETGVKFKYTIPEFM